MGKIPHRRIIRSEKDHIGCMWGFISIFDFRRGGYNRKLLADKRSGNKVLSGIGGSQNMIRNLRESDYQLDDEDCESTQPMLGDGKVSVKKLMEEDMVVEKKRKQNSDDAENQDSDFQCQSHKRSSSTYQQKRKYSSVSSDMDLANDADIDNLVREIFSRIQQRSVEHEEEMDNFCVLLEKKHAKFEKQLIEATKVILRGKLISGMPLGQDGKIHYSKEFMDAVDALVSHKELFFKLLEDPNSKLTRRINNLLNAEQWNSDNLKESHGPHHRKHHHLFSRRRVRSQEVILLSDNEISEAPCNNNASLDPGSEASSASISVKSCESSLKTKSLFSFTEIKRKLKHAMGKDREGVSTKNEMVKRIPRGNQSRETVGRMSLSPSRNPHLEVEIHPKRLSSPRRSDISGVERSEMNLEYEVSSPSKQKMSNSSFLEPHHIHTHSSHVLTDENDHEKFYERQDLELAKKSACTPDRASSPTFSPARKSSCSSPSAHIRLSSPRKSLNSNADSQVLEQANNLNVAEDLSGQSELDDTLSTKLESWDPSPIISILGDGEDVPRCSVEMSLEGNVKDLLLQTTEKLSKNESAQLGISVYTVEDEGDAMEVFEAETAAAFEEQDENYGDFTASPKAPCSDKMEQFGDLTSRMDRPSPISVLEPVYLDGEISPAPTELLPGELPVAPLKIYFDEDDLSESDKSVVDKKQPCHDNESKQKYIKEILTASGFSWNKFYMRSLSSDQLLDISLYDAELYIHSDQASKEYKLLFDCANGVVMDLCARYFGGSPLTPLSKYRPIPDTKNAFEEIWEGMEWHLRPLSPPWSLEQIVAKDLARDGRWMDLRFDADTIGTEIEDMILQELVEDTVMSCFSEECTDDEASSAMMSVAD